MRKFKLFIDYDKEETWLTEMAQKGYELENVSFGYKFRSIKPENFTYRTDYRNFKKREDFIDYCILFEDTGWKHIAGSKYSGVQYFKKVSENAEDDIFSDAISKAGRYKRLSNMWMESALWFFVISISYLSTIQINLSTMLNPKLLYYTPGLWERTGVGFWGGFLFETPFVFLRNFVFLMPLISVLFAYLSIKSRRIYNKQIKDT